MSGPPLRVVRADNPSPMTLDGTRTFVVGRARPAIIDPGPDRAEHVDALVDQLAGSRPVAILLTHLHPDHAGCAAELSRRTGAPLGSSADVASAVATSGVATRPLRDGDAVATDVGTLRVLATPGHAPEHLSFLWAGGEAPGGGALFVGDLMMGSGDTTLVAPPEGNLREYLASLDRVQRVGAAVLYPAHGPPLADPLAAVERFRDHRRHRIDQVRRELRRGVPARAEDLVDPVYGPALPPALRGAAVGSLRAILIFLREEMD